MIENKLPYKKTAVLCIRNLKPHISKCLKTEQQLPGSGSGFSGLLFGHPVHCRSKCFGMQTNAVAFIPQSTCLNPLLKGFITIKEKKKPAE